MPKKDKFEKEYKEFMVSFFEENFVGKSLNKAMYNTSRDVILDLTSILVKVSLIIECLVVIKKDKSYLDKINPKTTKSLKYNIITLKLIRKDLEKILKPIAEGLSNKI